MFSNDELPATYTTTLMKKDIYIDCGDKPSLLTAAGGDTFDLGGETIHFVRSKNGKVKSLELKLSRTGSIVFKKTNKDD